MDNATANQMAKTFPYILESGVLQEIIAQDLGRQSVPGKIEADVMENTNLFTLKVTADDPEMANKILQSVVKNYPTVAEFVIGSSQLTLMDESGVPASRQICSATVMKSSSAVLSEWFYVFCWIFCLRLERIL